MKRLVESVKVVQKQTGTVVMGTNGASTKPFWTCVRYKPNLDRGDVPLAVVKDLQQVPFESAPALLPMDLEIQAVDREASRAPEGALDGAKASCRVRTSYAA